MSPEKPRIAGELRLRVTSSNDAAYFESGSDLMRTDGQIWSRPLYSLSKYFVPLYEKLREERLLPDDLDTVLSTFPFDFSTRKSTFLVVTEQGVESLVMEQAFSDHRVIHQCKRPYTGALYISHTPVLIIHMNLYRKCLGKI